MTDVNTKQDKCTEADSRVEGLVMCAYFEEMCDYGMQYTELKPTGRWKLESGPWYTGRMFVEHRGWLFKHWVSETIIVFKPERKTMIFECT